MHAASELVADEASLLVANGPGVLAECLVALGTKLMQPRAAGWLVDVAGEGALWPPISLQSLGLVDWPAIADAPAVCFRNVRRECCRCVIYFSSPRSMVVTITYGAL